MNKYLVFFAETYPSILYAHDLFEVVEHYRDAVAIILVPNGGY